MESYQPTAAALVKTYQSHLSRWWSKLHHPNSITLRLQVVIFCKDGLLNFVTLCLGRTPISLESICSSPTCLMNSSQNQSLLFLVQSRSLMKEARQLQQVEPCGVAWKDSQSRRFCLEWRWKIMFISVLASESIHRWYLEGFIYTAQTYRANVAKICTIKVLWLLFCTELKDRNRSPHSNRISDTFLQKISEGLDQRHYRRRPCVIRQTLIIAPLLHEDKCFTYQTLETSLTD